MKTDTLEFRRLRVIERIAAGRADFFDDLDVMLDPLRRVDRVRAAWDRIWGQAGGFMPMLYPLAPVGALVLMRGRRRIGGALTSVLRLALKSAALARGLRQLSPFLAQIAARHPAAARR